jgi:hypothetical protein
LVLTVTDLIHAHQRKWCRDIEISVQYFSMSVLGHKQTLSSPTPDRQLAANCSRPEKSAKACSCRFSGFHDDLN